MTSKRLMVALAKDIAQDDPTVVTADLLVARALIKFEERAALPLARLLEAQARLEGDGGEVLLQQLWRQAH